MKVWAGWVILGALLVTASAEAQILPLRGLVRPQVEADPNKEYRLTEAQGPFMVMAATFSGEVGRDQAHALVIELRQRYNLEAYLYEKIFDHNEQIRLNGVDPNGNPRTGRYQRGGRLTEWAVMVGNYASVDEASPAHKRIKELNPECMMLGEDRPDARSLGALRAFQRWANSYMDFASPGAEKRDLRDKWDRGPLSYSFVTLNPLKPKNSVVSRGLSPEIIQLNKPLEYSLLKCPGKYTIKVATFTGRVITDPKEVARLEGQELTNSQLAEGERKAHDLAVELRRRGYEAYEFHDRYASMVFVGSFDTLGEQIQGGQLNLRPEIVTIMNVFGAHKETDRLGNPDARVGQPKIIMNIPLDIQPQPVEVPRESVGAAYNPSW